jgi:hypothetical protein
MASLVNLPRLMAAGNPEQKKEFVNCFIAGITVHPDAERLDVAIRKIPAGLLSQPGNSSVGMVAGARYDQVQIIQSVAFRGQEWVVRRAA